MQQRLVLTMISKEDFIFPRGTVRVGLTQPKILLVLAAALLLAALCLVLAVHLKYGSASVTVGADGGRNEVIYYITCS